jgi:F0F1-type ATP synthase membrane subunit c/vacuolar-type H+-ATPase subunit K
MPLYTGFVQLGAGLSVGLSGLAAGFAIGIVGDAGVRGTAQQPRLFVGMVCLISLNSVRAAYRHKLDPHPHFRRSFGLVWYVEQTSARTVL